MEEKKDQEFQNIPEKQDDKPAEPAQQAVPVQQNYQYIQGPTQYMFQSSEQVNKPLSESRKLQAPQPQSRIEYVPYEKTIVEYEQVQRVEKIPHERKIIEYEEVTRTELVPREKKVVDYYAVQHEIEYIPNVYQDKYVEYVPQECVKERVEYKAVEKSVIHAPQDVQQQVFQSHVLPQQQQQQQQDEKQSASQVKVVESVQQPMVQSYVIGQHPYQYVYPQSYYPQSTILPPQVKPAAQTEKPQVQQKKTFFDRLFGD